MTVAMMPLSLVFVGLLSLTSAGTLISDRANSETNTLSAQSSNASGGAWRLVRTPNPRGGPDAVSIMHTADTSRSDINLAGLMIRCSPEGSEIAIVLLNAYPVRARPQVTFGRPGHEKQFAATIGAPGTAVVLPGDPKSVLGEAWSAEKDLFIRVADGPNSTSGVVPLVGVQSAFALLKANCLGP